MKLFQPIQGALNEKMPNVIAVATVKVQRRAPGSAIEIREIWPVLVEVISLGAEVVVNHVEANRELLRMRGVDQPLQIARSSVTVLHGKRKDAVVSPVACARELRNRHYLNRCNAEISQPIEMRNQCRERAFWRVGANVQLVNYSVAQRDTLPCLIGPWKRARIDDL